MNAFSYNKNNIKFSIYIYLQIMDILIQCIYSDENKYSSVFNLEKLKNIDKLFSGFPPLSLTDIYEILFKYFNENEVFIKEVSNSRIIIEIEKDVKPNMKFELKRDKINDMDYQNMDINYNENLMNNNNISNDSNYTNKMINKRTANNNTIFLNECMNDDNMNDNQISQIFSGNWNYNVIFNNNGNMLNNINFNNNNKNMINNCNNKNLLTNTISNYNNDLKITKLNKNDKNQKDTNVCGGLNNIKNDNFNYNKNNSPFHIFKKYNNNNHLDINQNQISSSINIRVGQPKNNQK